MWTVSSNQCCSAFGWTRVVSLCRLLAWGVGLLQLPRFAKQIVAYSVVTVCLNTYPGDGELWFACQKISPSLPTPLKFRPQPGWPRLGRVGAMKSQDAWSVPGTAPLRHIPKPNPSAWFAEPASDSLTWALTVASDRSKTCWPRAPHATTRVEQYYQKKSHLWVWCD